MFKSAHVRPMLVAAMIGSLLSAHVALAAPPGNWGQPTGGSNGAMPVMQVDPEVSSGSVDVLTSANAQNVGGIGAEVVMWNSEITGPWGTSVSDATVEDASGSLGVHLETRRSAVAVQFTTTSNTVGFAWGIRSFALVKTKGSVGVATHQVARIRLCGKTDTLPEAIVAANSAASFYSALPAPGQAPAPPSTLSPPTGGTWAAYWNCVSTCFGQAHPAALQTMVDCFSGLGYGVTVGIGHCLLDCLGVPPCVQACLAILGPAALAVAGACIAGYLAMCTDIAARCAWECW